MVCSRARKPKDFKEIHQKADAAISENIKLQFLLSCSLQHCSTIFNVAGPKILGKATTALIGRSDGERFREPEALILERLEAFFCLCLVCICASAVFNFIQGWIMTGITQKVCYQLQKRNLREN